MNAVKCAALATALAMVTLGAPEREAWAGGSPKGYSGRFGKVTTKHYAVHPEGSEFYAEEWEIRAWTDAGESVSVNFVINNLGFGDNKLVVQASARPAGGKKTKAKKKYDDDDWSHSNSPFRIEAGGNTLSGGPGKLQAKVSVGGVKVDITIVNQLPAWRPANGRLNYGEPDEYYDFTYLAPRAKVSGTVVVGGKEFTLKDAVGWADHRIVNVPPNVAGKRWLTWRSFDGDWTVLIQEVQFPSDVGGRKSRFLLVGYKDRIVFQSIRFKVKYGSLKNDAKSSKGYKYPLGLRIEANSGDRTVVMTVKGKLSSRKDLLSSLGAAKALVSRFVAPVGYYINGEYDLRVVLDGQTFTHHGKGAYVFKQVNP